MRLKSLYAPGCFTKLGRFFSNTHLEKNKLLNKYPNIISTERLDQILEESSQKHTCVIEKPDAIDKQYPNLVDSDKLEITLKEAEETRKKFSVY